MIGLVILMSNPLLRHIFSDLSKAFDKVAYDQFILYYQQMSKDHFWKGLKVTFPTVIKE